MVLGLFGAGGAGRGLYDALSKDQRVQESYERIVFVDDVVGVAQIDGVDVLTFDEAIRCYGIDELKFLICLGGPASREKVYYKIKEKGYSLATWIHPRAEIAATVSLGEGNIIYDCYLDVGVTIGNNVLIYKNAVIGHDSVVKDHSVVSVGTFIGGHCVLETKTYFGPCAAARDQVHVGQESTVGINAAVFKDVPDGSAAIGNPAKIVPKSQKGLFEK